MQQTLAGEHAALDVLGFLGAQTSSSAQPDLARAIAAAYSDHRDARDRLTDLIGATGTDPVAAGTDYVVPGPSGTPAQVRATALVVERRTTLAYGALVARTSGSARRFAISALDAGALRELTLGGRPRSFPGID